MQENRSFDHALGHLQGVRGYNDPRAIHLPNKNKVWLQTNERGETYAPFHLDMHGTKATWMGSLHHNWWDMVDARNQDRKSTRLNSSHVAISYAVFCLKKIQQMKNKYANRPAQGR